MPSRKSKTTSSEPLIPPINNYGLDHITAKFPYATQDVYDRAAFIMRLPFERVGMTMTQLYRKISDTMTPGYHEWHAWTEKFIDALTEYRWIGVAGCSNSAKSHNLAGFAVNWWMMAPTESAVIFCSTTIKALRKKGWARIQQAYAATPAPRYGNFVDSRMVWQCKRGDDEHAIYGIAVEEGSTTKVADNIKGIHASRMLLCLDEGTAIPEAIMDAASNMWSYPMEFILCMMGNPRMKLDQFGRFIEPKNGWISVNVDTEEWETKPQMDGKCGKVIRFDAMKSPNVTEGRLVSKHLPRPEKLAAASKNLGGPSTPLFWSNFRGFFPPDGIERTVFSENALVAGHCYDQPVWTGDTFMVGGFDPAFTCGGDCPQFQPIQVGETDQGKVAFLWPQITIPILSDSPIPASYQLAQGLKAAAEKCNVPPANICVDGTGNQVCDVISREWSPSIQRIISTWSASDREVSYEDHKLSCDVYRNKITEMWFQARQYCDAGQLRGMSHDLAGELCSRLYEPENATKKRSLEDKTDMKVRIGKSPDRADAMALGLEAARRAGLEIKPQGTTVKLTGNFQREVKLALAAVTEDAYANSNAQEEALEPMEFEVW